MANFDLPFLGGKTRRWIDIGGNVIVQPVTLLTSGGAALVDANSAANTTGTGLLGVGNLGFDGTNWQRLETRANGDAAVAAGNQLLVSARLSTYNGTTYDRGRDATTAAGTVGTGVLAVGGMIYDGTNVHRMRDATAPAGTTGQGLLGTGLLGFDGTNWQRLEVRTNGDGATAAGNQLVVSARGQLYNGTSYDRLRDANTAQNTIGTGLAAAGLLAYDGTNWQRCQVDTNKNLQVNLNTGIWGEDAANGILRVGLKGGGWNITHNPTVGNVATISQAAGSGTVRNVLTSLSFGIANDATGPVATILTVNLRDGASGSGTVLRAWTLFAPTTIGYNFNVSLAGLWIEGSQATAMTLEFAGGLAHTLEYVNISGCTIAA